MKITGGENYLTMKKSERLTLKKNPDNFLIEIDVKSSEPALLNALYEFFHTFFVEEISAKYCENPAVCPTGLFVLECLNSFYVTALFK